MTSSHFVTSFVIEVSRHGCQCSVQVALLKVTFSIQVSLTNRYKHIQKHTTDGLAALSIITDTPLL